MSQEVYAPRRRIALLGATAMLAVMASPMAFAQTVPQTSPPAPGTSTAGAEGVPAAATQQIVVTGTRIANTNASSANPITVVTSKQIAESSSQTIEDVLQKLPAIGSSGLYGTTNNGGVGLSCTDIRNLGISRVLVLVDGHRFVHDSDGVADCVDLNNIPLQMVDQIQVLKDGASSIYGADAVAGVVNIILKKNFVGTTATLEGDLPTRGGGSTGKLSVTTGETFDKGNITLGFEYLNKAPVSQGSRNWSNRINSGYTGSTGNDFGSGSIPYGRIAGISPSGNNATIPFGGDLRVKPDGTAVPYNGSTDSYDFAPAQDLVGGLERESLSTLAHYDFNEYMTGYVEAFFTHKLTTEQLAPEPVYTNSSSALPDPFFVVPAGNPYLAGLSVGGVPFSTLYPGQNALVRQRATYLGDRQYTQESNTFEITGGIRGVLPYDVTYDTFYTFGVSDSTNETKNSANIANLEQVAGYSYTPGTFLTGTYDPSVCTGGCTLSNPFQLSSASAKYVAYNETDTSAFNLRTYGLDLSKKDVFELPYGGVGLAFGFDHREENGNYNTDNLVATGLTNESPQQPTGGGFSTNEVYGETRIPILADLPFAKALTLDLSGRFFSYNTFGSGETWKIGGDYAIIPDIRFRANIGTAFRQPSVSELYTSPVNSANAYHDPCSHDQVISAVTAANCAAQGVKPTFVSQESQLNTLIGGNPDLQPETARTETAGMVLTPHWVPNSSITVDYFRTKINNSIGALDTQTILTTCYNSVNLSSPLCADIGPRDVTGEITNAIATNQNLGVTKTSGIDLGLTYNLPIGDLGAVNLTNNAEFVINYFQQNQPNGPFTDYNGQIQDALNGTAFPRWKDDNTITYSNGPLTLGYTTRFISTMTFDEFSGCGSPATCRTTSTPNVFYHDIQATYTYNQATLTVGVDNILDEPPPFVDDGTTNTAPEIFDVVGRTVYAKLAMHF
jgi:iron complex outermembrane receptor protein